MSDPKSTLIPLLLQANVLSFGQYTLKSGRESPYFFTSSLLHSATLLGALASGFASVLTSAPFSTVNGTQVTPQYDIIFGPAYKGIPLTAIITRELALHLPTAAASAISYSFNRKESKDHGEGGTIVGAPLKGKRVVIVDDVITAGTALREAVSIIQAQGGQVVGVVVMLTREERVSDTESRSALKVAEDDLKLPVRAVLSFSDIVQAIKEGKMGENVGEKELEAMRVYREKYGAQD